jgi:hypothetical protein
MRFTRGARRKLKAESRLRIDRQDCDGAYSRRSMRGTGFGPD